MSYRSAIIVTALSLARPVSAGVITWINNTGGNWNTPANWDVNDVPDSATDDAAIGVVGIYTVMLDISPTINSLTINNATATLDLNGNMLSLLGATGLDNSGQILLVAGAATIDGAITNQSGGEINLRGGTTLNFAGPVVTNNGIITVNSNNSAATTIVNVTTSTQLDGSGELILNRVGLGAQLNSDVGPTLTNGSQHTIRGLGRVNAALVNDGTVTATFANNALELSNVDKTNNGLMSATDDGRLDVFVNVDGSGAWTADNGVIRLNAGVAVTTTGPINVLNDGLLQLINADMTGSDLTLDGTGRLSVGSTITLSGNLSFSTTEEGRWSWDDTAILALTGGSPADCPHTWALLEVGGRDTGAAGAVLTNFGLPTLIVEDGAAVTLVDANDNGNRGAAGESEALYVETLIVGAGAKINLNGLHLYANGQEVVPGPFDGGTIIDAQGGDIDGDGDVDRADRLCFSGCLSPPGDGILPGCDAADVNEDGQVTCQDWYELRAMTGTFGPVFVPCDVARGPVLQSAPLTGLPEVTTRELDFGDSLTELSFDVHVGSAVSRYIVDADADWITLSPAASATPNIDTIVVRVDRSALPPGQHIGIISVTVPQERGARDVTVRITVPSASVVEVPDAESAELSAPSTACGSGGMMTISMLSLGVIALRFARPCRPRRD